MQSDWTAIFLQWGQIVCSNLSSIHVVGITIVITLIVSALIGLAIGMLLMYFIMKAKINKINERQASPPQQQTPPPPQM